MNNPYLNSRLAPIIIIDQNFRMTISNIDLNLMPHGREIISDIISQTNDKWELSFESDMWVGPRADKDYPGMRASGRTTRMIESAPDRAMMIAKNKYSAQELIQMARKMNREDILVIPVSLLRESYSVNRSIICDHDVWDSPTNIELYWDYYRIALSMSMINGRA